ncbi:uncharacterized protein ASCRUDRAFT_68701 [Ascoidea rubescens DSM 1968]|uniref:Uncharacterized protein n=1 Tax=Ascoidea rubescens DSM 1968 TaxID=1344418 RepID=A0A1D2VMR1_9ASCO|nr:hypothetical protein ASCRUDRAFT_68701 [Ascoidea rubescens DSM 1968]ODV62901.1 hypothetical protein ASCRUDRAFT_68701 [Ascoidea rubescens DSM 1968]
MAEVPIDPAEIINSLDEVVGNTVAGCQRIGRAEFVGSALEETDNYLRSIYIISKMGFNLYTPSNGGVESGKTQQQLLVSSSASLLLLLQMLQQMLIQMLLHNFQSTHNAAVSAHC